MAGIGSLNVGGLASGLDTQQLIEDLIKVDSAPLNRLRNQRSVLSEQTDVFTSMKTSLLDMKNTMYELKRSSTLGAFSASSSDEEALGVSATASAQAGTYDVRIISLAQAETRSSASYQSNNTNLGLTGGIVVNGISVKVRASDSLIDIRDAINAADAGVKANILKVAAGDYRLIVSAEDAGSEGFTFADIGTGTVLESLGFTDGATGIRQIENGAVVSGRFAAANSTLGSQIGLSQTVAGSVAIRGQELAIDLATDSLASIRDKINGLGIDGVSAEVESVESEDGQTLFRLAIAGTTEFTDDSGVLETIGILAGGTSGVKTEFQSGTLTIGQSSLTADESTYLHQLGAQYGDTNETIVISGTDHQGNAVSTTFTIEQQSTVGDVLAAVEDTFGGDVNARIEDGRIIIESTAAGESALSVNLDAVNENGGTLDFGTVSEMVRGRDRVVVNGTDAVLMVNNIKVARNTNEISDVLSGLSLSLKKADANTTLSITVEQDTDAIKEKLQGFVDDYNEIINYVNEHSEYDDETNEAGPLLGDLTARTTLSQLQRVIQTVVNDTGLEFTQLAQIGVELTADGTLDINSTLLNEALTEHPEDVISLFTVNRTASDNDISFVYSSNKTAAGTYDVTITRAAEQAEATSAELGNRLGTSGTLTVTDDLQSGLTVDYTADMTASDLANRINEEAQSSYAREITSSAALTAGGQTITQTTSIGDIDGVTAEAGDTISITGTRKSGAVYQRIITLSDETDTTMQDVLNQIVGLNNTEVHAAIDQDGRIVVRNTDTGASSLDLTIETTIAGLSFGEFDVTTEGRGTVSVSASVTDNGSVAITQDSYGSAKTFSVSGGDGLGLSDGTYSGVDIAGTINGVAGTGKGAALNASTDDTASRGIIINSTITPEELAAEGPSQGTITLVAGIAERMYNELTTLTDPVNGFIEVRIDSIELETQSLDDRIDSMNDRIEQRRVMYVRRFTELEKAMARLQSLQQQISGTLASLPTTSLI